MTRPFGQIEGFVGLEQGPAGLELRAGPGLRSRCAASVRRLSSPGPVPPASPRCHHAGAAFTKTEGKPSLPPLTLPRPRPAEGDCCTLPTQLTVKEPLGTAASAWSSVVASAYSSSGAGQHWHPPPPAGSQPRDSSPFAGLSSGRRRTRCCRLF